MSGRMVSAEEARDVIAREAAGTFFNLTPIALDAMHTVVQQAEQIAAVLALHSDVHECSDGWWYPHDAPCPTARALGIES